MSLLERDAAIAAVEAALAEAWGGAGRVILVAGEAGLGKTALVQEVAARVDGRARVLAGACDPLLTPARSGRSTTSGALPRAMVIEDAHWADEATIDLLAVLGRRVAPTTGALVATMRGDEVGRALCAAVAALPPSVVRRIDLAPLSSDGVAAFAAGAGRPPTASMP